MIENTLYKIEHVAKKGWQVFEKRTEIVIGYYKKKEHAEKIVKELFSGKGFKGRTPKFITEGWQPR